MHKIIISPESYPQAYGAFLSEYFSRFKEDITEYDDEPDSDGIWEVDGKLVEFYCSSYRGHDEVEIVRRHNLYGITQFWFDDGSRLEYNCFTELGWVFHEPEKEE